MNEIRVLYSRHRTELHPLFEKAGIVVKEGVDVGGDVRIAWDTDNEDEVAAVGKLFDELKDKSYQAVKVGDDGKLKDGQRMDKFQRDAGRMVMIPKMVGG